LLEKRYSIPTACARHLQTLLRTSEQLLLRENGRARLNYADSNCPIKTRLGHTLWRQCDSLHQSVCYAMCLCRAKIANEDSILIPIKLPDQTSAWQGSLQHTRQVRGN